MIGIGVSLLSSAIAVRSENARDTDISPAFVERSQEAFRSYYDALPRGTHVVEYTMRLNTPGRYALPPSRVEALYAPDVYGALPNAAFEVQP